MIRATLERLSRGRSHTRRLPKEYGGCVLYVSPEGVGMRYWMRDISRTDKPLIDVCSEVVQPGTVVWDVGANIELFSFCAAG